MRTSGFLPRALAAALLAFVLVSMALPSVVWAQEPGAAAAGPPMVWHYLGAAIGLGMIVIGAALGIGRFASAAADGIARQPGAADKITGAVNLPLFLLEGVAIIAEVVVLLIVLTK